MLYYHTNYNNTMYYVCVYMYICIYVDVHIYIYIYIGKAWLVTCASSTRRDTCVRALCMYVYISLSLSIYIYIYTYYIHIYNYMYIYIYSTHNKHNHSLCRLAVASYLVPCRSDSAKRDNTNDSVVVCIL